MKYRVTLNDKIYEVEVEETDATLISVSDARANAQSAVVSTTSQTAAQPQAAPITPGAGETVSSPLPGNVIEISASEGQAVKSGQVLCVIEAMKMENEVLSPRDGTVLKVVTTRGAAVESGAPLFIIS